MKLEIYLLSKVFNRAYNSIPSNTICVNKDKKYNLYFGDTKTIVSLSVRETFRYGPYKEKSVKYF